MTAHAMWYDSAKCLEAGMDDYISKPVSVEGLRTVLETWIKGGEVQKKPEPSSQSGRGAPSGVAAPVQELESGQDEAPLWDRQAFLARLMGDEDLAAMVVETFLEDISRQVTTLEGFIAAGDKAGAERQLHTMKGACSNVGAGALAARISALEDLAKTDGKNLHEGIAAVHSGLQDLRKAMSSTN
jgi:HPt (histidine-containing phosphotransfer) domain-containing protein